MKKKKIIKEPVKPKMYGARVSYSSYCNVTKEANSDDEWDADDLAYSYTPQYLTAVSDKYSADVLCTVPVEYNKPYFLVTVTYRTGNSFHHETGRITEVALFDNEEDAKELQKLIEKNDEEISEFEFKGHSIYNGAWTGYFERIESVNVDGLYLKDEE